MREINYQEPYYRKEAVIIIPGINNDRPIDCSIQVRDIKGSDCMVGHFGYNIFYRTKSGTLSKTYKSEGTMEEAIKRATIKNGYQFIKFINRE